MWTTQRRDCKQGGLSSQSEGATSINRCTAGCEWGPANPDQDFAVKKFVPDTSGGVRSVSGEPGVPEGGMAEQHPE